MALVAQKKTSLEPIVKATHIWKQFKVYKERNQSLKEIVLRGRRADYQTFWALKDVSFQVEKGRTFGIIGENGSGKSTILKILAKILRPQRGSVQINGKVSALLELGAGFHPDLTGRENIFLNGSILGLSRKEIERRFQEIIAFSELEKFIDSPVKNYSSGMYLRLGFAVAINVDPDVLLVDEILAVGDESFQRKCMNKLYELKNRGKTIVIVSHALDLLANICEEAIWLEKGETKASGPARKVVESYLEEVNRQEQEKSGYLNEADKNKELGSRWGSGEILIDKVELLDNSGKTPKVFVTGKPMTIRFSYQVKNKIHRPVFGMLIHTRSGILCSGTNSRIAGLVPEELSGSGTLQFTINELPLLAGEYLLSLASHDYSGLHEFDFHDKRYLFRVSAGDNYDVGLFKLNSKWQLKTSK